MATLVRLVTSVGPDVLLKVGQLGELPLADLAPEDTMSQHYLAAQKFAVQSL